MKNKLSGTCPDPDFFRALDPTQSAPACRVQILTAYSDRELAPELEAKVQSHVGKCPPCASFVASLEEPEGAGSISTAVCPSSELLDRFLFDRLSVPAGEATQIEDHLRECALCREECEWLKDVESPALAFRPRSAVPIRLLLAAAAVAVIALAAALFWRGGASPSNADQLRALAVIKEPAQINYAELQHTSAPLDPAAEAAYADAVDDFKRGSYGEAAGGFEKVLKAAPGHSGAVFLLGYSYYKMNQPEKAFELCNRAEEMRPHSYERCMFLVNIALKTGNFRRAYTEISALYHEAPQVPAIHDLYHRIAALMPDQRKL